MNDIYMVLYISDDKTQKTHTHSLTLAHTQQTKRFSVSATVERNSVLIEI